MTTKPYEYIDTNEALGGLVDHIEDADIIAIDTEANSLYNYFERVCLIQLTVGRRHFIGK